MKFKVVAMGLVAANFAFTSMASGQQYGYGQYGGNVPCGYPNGPASGATSQDDDRADLIQQKRDLQDDLREAKKDQRDIDKEKAKILAELQDQFDPDWMQTFQTHMDGQRNCRICGSDLPPVGPSYPPPTYGGKGGDDGGKGGYPETGGNDKGGYTPGQTGGGVPGGGYDPSQDKGRRPVPPPGPAAPSYPKPAPGPYDPGQANGKSGSETGSGYDPGQNGRQPPAPAPAPNPGPYDPSQGTKAPPAPVAAPPAPKPVAVAPAPVAAPPAPKPVAAPPAPVKIVSTTQPSKAVTVAPVSVTPAAKAKPTTDAAKKKCNADVMADPKYKASCAKNPNNGACHTAKVNVCGFDMASNDMPKSDRMPASFSGDRRPAGNGETGGSGGGVTRGPTAPQGGVSAGSDVTCSGFSCPGRDFDPGSGGGAYPGDSGDAGPSACYNNEPPYTFKAWKKPSGVCRDHGQLSPEVCRIGGFQKDRQSAGNYAHCQSNITRYLKLVKESEKNAKRMKDDEDDIDWVTDQIKDLTPSAREKRERENEDKLLEASGSRRSSRGGGGSSGPSTGRTALGVIAGLGAGVGTYLALNGADRSAWRQNNDALTSLGWQTLPYQANPASIGAGLGVGTTVMGAILGGQNGAYGCGQMATGQINPSIFGNPYGGNGYGQLGGGMYNGAGPWGVAGPWGNSGLGGGAQFGAGFGGPGYGNQFGGGGFPGIGGQFGAGYGAPGYGSQFGSGGFPGIGGQFGAGGYPGYGAGGFPGIAGQFGAGYGAGGYPSGYGGIGGGLGGIGYQQQLQQMQYEQQLRGQSVAAGNQYQAQELLQQQQQISQQLSMLGGGYGGAYGSSYGSGYGYPSYGAGISAYFGAGSTPSYNYGYPSTSYNPSIYGSSILTPSTGVINTR